MGYSRKGNDRQKELPDASIRSPVSCHSCGRRKNNLRLAGHSPFAVEISSSVTNRGNRHALRTRPKAGTENEDAEDAPVEDLPAEAAADTEAGEAARPAGVCLEVEDVGIAGWLLLENGRACPQVRVGMPPPIPR